MDMRPGPPQIWPGLPEQVIWHAEGEEARAPPLRIEESQKHWLEYSSPAMVWPREEQVEMHDSMVLLLESGCWDARIRPLVWSV